MTDRLLPVLLAVLVGLCAACDDGDVQVRVEPTPPGPGVRAPQGERRLAEVVVYDDRLEPRQIALSAAVPVQIQIGNRSDRDCRFFVGDFLAPLPVEAGSTGKMSLTVPVDRADEIVPMGCEGDPSREGTAVFEFTGLLPGEGR